jgi:pimeloyl-ACP methyl ester carboxylesterase
MRRSTSIVVLFVLFAAGLAGAGTAVARGSSVLRLGTSRSVRLFDANIQYTSGVFLPLTPYTPTSVQPLTTDAWTSAARSVSRVGSDGATLILIRAELAPNNTLPVTFLLVPDNTGADPGSLWAIDDQSVVDVSSPGGTLDGQAGPPALTVDSVVVNGRRYAFLLYRAPRNFDGSATAQLASRSPNLVMVGSSSAPVIVATLTIVRPLVVFLHGTFADNDTWASFPLWQNSANEMSNFQPSASTLPFAADRISFNWIWNATGGVVDNAQTILPQLVRAVRDWREATGAAATQADVVTHSFGGFIAREVVQTQPDLNPLTSADLANFRAATNWGHGSIHKLVTLAATHRGSASANATADVNQNGETTGNARLFGCAAGEYIDQGAIRDQMVLSAALNALGQTRVPGHALVGSGRAELDPSGFYKTEDKDFATLLDKSTGPYATAFSDPNCPYDALDNYTFNLDKNVPPFSGSGATCSVTPNYDLVVSAYSSQGLMPAGATTLPTDLEKASGLELIGKLNHSALHDPTFGSAAIVGAVSDRVLFLLQQPTTSAFFSRFPAVASVAPTSVEKDLSKFDPAWLTAGSQCPSPTYQSGCTADYTSIKAIPAQLTLENATPAPLFAYGLLNGQWVLAYSPTFIFASAPPINRNCAVTLTSSDTSVVDFLTNSITGASVPQAKGVGTATITINVQGFTGNVPAVPVTVTGTGN